jgi:hypothetical protein
MRIIVANIAVFLVLDDDESRSAFGESRAHVRVLVRTCDAFLPTQHCLNRALDGTELFFRSCGGISLVVQYAFLYRFGTIIQDFIGTQRIVKLYFWGGIAGAIAYLLMVNNFAYFIQKGPTFLNGASAGVFAIVVAAATIKPSYRVHLFLFGDVQIKYISAFYVIWSFIETTESNAGGNIAHLGGALMGFI